MGPQVPVAPADESRVKSFALALVPDEEVLATDPRVAAVLQVLSGDEPAAVARQWAVDAAVLERWVATFVDAGSGAVTNRPDPDATRQRDRFLAAFAHELRTPLAVAQGWVAMLEDLELDPLVGRTVGRLEEALARLTARTLDVELLASASLGLLRLDQRTVPLSELFAGLGPTDGRAPDLPVTVDPRLFPLVLRDLWHAARSAPTPRALRWEVETVPPWTEIRLVRDADPIDHQVLQALFEPFDHNDDATGVTIGLYLARALTVAHGGTLGIRQDDEGAVLWIRIPATPHHSPTDIEETR